MRSTLQRFVRRLFDFILLVFLDYVFETVDFTKSEHLVIKFVWISLCVVLALKHFHKFIDVRETIVLISFVEVLVVKLR